MAPTKRKVSSILLSSQADKIISPQKRKSSQSTGANTVVTPSGRRARSSSSSIRSTALSHPKIPSPLQRVVTPSLSRSPSSSHDEQEEVVARKTRRKLAFGKEVVPIEVKEQVKAVYKIVKKHTGSLGGNASSGAIYGELTVGSMQKMVNLMKEHTGFRSSSRFIDVGSGIGKPNLHVAQDPGCEFSYGIEMERSRWMLGMACLKSILQEAIQKPEAELGHKIFFQHDNVMNAETLDPFTHVYCFSIGFPPKLWERLADMWNRSDSSYLICYAAPRYIIDTYDFDVELVTQTPTSMHASGEGHTGYIYKRTILKPDNLNKCDPFFEPALSCVQNGLATLSRTIDEKMEHAYDGGLATRSRGIRHVIERE